MDHAAGRLASAVVSPSTLALLDEGEPVTFSFDDMLRYHGRGSPGGVAHAFKVLERALPVLDRTGLVERRAIRIRTAFSGPGARDGFELVTRAVTDGRYEVDAALADASRGRALERFVFWVATASAEVGVELCPGFVSEEFVELAGAPSRSEEDERRLVRLKREMAVAVMAAPAAEVYAERLVKSV